MIRVEFDDGVVTFRGSVEVPADELSAVAGQIVEHSRRVILNVVGEGQVTVDDTVTELEPGRYVIVSEGLFKEVAVC